MSNNLINNFCIMNEVVLPIKTSREGNKITKVCVEDIYKLLNRIQDEMNRSFNKTVDVIDSVHKEVTGVNVSTGEDTVVTGEFIIGTGVSQPCLTDAFDEEIGNNIAFMKAKLNANIKKHNLLCRMLNTWLIGLEAMDKELVNIDEFIKMDLKNIRKHNPEYLLGLEEKLEI